MNILAKFTMNNCGVSIITTSWYAKFSRVYKGKLGLKIKSLKGGIFITLIIQNLQAIFNIKITQNTLIFFLYAHFFNVKLKAICNSFYLM